MEIDLLTLAKQSGYPAEAFLFVQRGLEYTVRRVHGERPAQPSEREKSPSRHVTGQMLCQGLRDYALQQYGLLARTVLKQWHIHSTEDFGKIVFAMVESGLMQKTPEDTVQDFVDVFDFNQAFAAELELSNLGTAGKAV